MKTKLLFKSLLVAATLLLGGANSAWAAAPTLTASYEVDNYAKLCYTDFVDKTIDDGSIYDEVFDYGECVHREGYGLQNQQSGNRAFTVKKSIQKGDLIIIQAGETATYGVTVSVSSSVSNPIKKDGYYAFYVTNDVSSFTVTINRNNYVSAMQILRPSNTTYIVNAVKSDGTFLKQIATGTYSEDATIYYPVCIEKDGNYYRKDKNGSGSWWGFTNVAAGLRTIVYTAVDYAYYNEVEDMTFFKNGSGYNELRANGGSAPNRYSAGDAKRFFNKQMVYTSALAAGTYSVTLYARNSKNADRSGIGLKLRDSSGNFITLGSFGTWGSAEASEKTIENVVVPDGYNVCVYESTNNNSDIDVDYVYVVKTNNDATVSKTITSAGWATYCSPYALDFSAAIAGLDAAYLVTGGADDKLTLSPITTTIPANTGVLLKGSAGTVNIPVVASSSTDVSSNKLQGVNSETVLDLDDNDDGTADKSVFVLMNDLTNGLGFYQTTTTSFTLSANTAYLPSNFTSSPGARAFYSLGGDVTGIQELKNSRMEGSQSYYDLQGRRVANPTKGLYIVNGKKVIK